LQRRDLIPVLRDTGCLFVTSAVESLDDAVLERLQKGTYPRRFPRSARADARGGSPDVAHSSSRSRPWTTRESYRDFLRQLVELGLSEQVAPIQLAIRLSAPRRFAAAGVARSAGDRRQFRTSPR
jgi:hypothetical protein